jgi:exopolyphosphatase/guanosine-5'-triphosphate,3'-diphosphate pyrophosphatase
MRSTSVQSPESTHIVATGSCDYPSAPRVAALDLGSKNFKAVLGELQDRRIVTRLLGKRLVGFGADIAVNQGVISEETLDRARTALAELKAVCERAGSTEFLAVATRAVRTARNGGDVVDAARELGIMVEIATGEREAALGYLAVTNGKAGSLVCELGSQSMQLAWRQSGPIQSISIGAGYDRVYCEFIRDADSFSQARGA